MRAIYSTLAKQMAEVLILANLAAFAADVTVKYRFGANLNKSHAQMRTEHPILYYAGYLGLKSSEKIFQ